MCYVLHQSQPERERGAATPASTNGRLRPRWIAALLAALLGGAAVAALSVLPSDPPAGVGADPALLVPVAAAARATTTTTSPVIEQAGASMDDGVPADPGTTKAGAGSCHHGL